MRYSLQTVFFSKPACIIALACALLACSTEKSHEKHVNTTAFTSVDLLNAQVKEALPFEDTRDFERAEKGFLATLDDPVIKNPDGSTAIDLSAFDFLEDEAPTSTNPSLWRQSQLNRKHGLYEVVEGIYQVRGFDLANMTVIATNSGWIVIDPLTTEGVSAAALALVNKTLGTRPVKAVIITHSHIDHFGGIKGVITEEDVKNGVEIIAPEGFYEHAISENVIGGNTMKRRSSYMFGVLLPTDTLGVIGNGLGQKVSSGKVGILQPTIIIAETGQTLNIDGVEMVFQNTPDAEAPSECMFYFPQFRAFCQAEEINHTMHNLYTLRGTNVRNGLTWAKHLDKTIQLFGDKTDVSFGSHHWPTWGKEDILELWTKQRDMYKFVHDQTLHLANAGYTMHEIAERMETPKALASFFANREYYGTLSHNAKAQYQLYFGWFDGNPANLHALPPVEASEKYVAYMGGAAAILEKVQADIEQGNLRWAAMVLNHVVFAHPGNKIAREKLASVYRQLGFVAESGPWRNFYLTGAQELDQGVTTQHMTGLVDTDDIVRNLSMESFFDFMAVQMNRSKASGKTYTFNFIFPDVQDSISVYLVNDVLHNRPGVLADSANATITMDRAVFNDIITKKTTGLKRYLLGDISIEGSRGDYTDFQSIIEEPFDLYFNIIDP